jgi:small-conductance mechanosensitive channel
MLEHNILVVLSAPFMGNTVQQWLLAIVTFVITYHLFSLTKTYISGQLHKYFQKKHQYQLARIFTLFIDSVSWFFIVALGVTIASMHLRLAGKAALLMDELPLIALLIQIGYWGRALINYNLETLIASKPDIIEQKQLKTVATPIRFIVQSILWGVLLLACLANLGVNVTAFVTGLGIGGVAIALAVQSTLSDLIASLSIAFGKPFMVGDFIILDTAMGVVEAIGIKTTRVRSISGELIIVPNSQLMTSRIINCNNMADRRVVFTFSILNRTKTEDLQKIPELVRTIVLSQGKTRFDRAHFAKFSQFSFDYEVVYFIQNPDFNFYMDTQQAINLQLVESLRENHIALAYPLSEVSFPSKGLETVTSLLRENGFPQKTFSH